MRRLAPLLILPLVACGGNTDDPYENAPNAIVFGIEQSIDANAVQHLDAGYDFLGLARRDYLFRVFPDGAGNGSCYLERAGDRVGRAPSDPGAAYFTGGSIPAAGVQIVANQSGDTMLDGAGWKTGDSLHFSANGFAMPELPDVDMRVPQVGLTVTGVTPASAITAHDDVVVGWKPLSGKSRVLVSLDLPTAEVRCYTDGSLGSLTVPHELVNRLFATVDDKTPIAGHVTVATHEQVNITAPGNWVVYVVATSRAYDAPFTGTRD